KIAKRYEVSLDWIFGLTDNPAPAVDNKNSPVDLGELGPLWVHMTPTQRWQLTQIAYVLTHSAEPAPPIDPAINNLLIFIETHLGSEALHRAKAIAKGTG